MAGVGPDTVYLVSLPAGHNFPLACPGILGTLLAGGRVVLLPSPEPARAFATLAAEAVSQALLPSVRFRGGRLAVVPVDRVRSSWLERNHRPTPHSLVSRVSELAPRRLGTVPDVTSLFRAVGNPVGFSDGAP